MPASTVEFADRPLTAGRLRPSVRPRIAILASRGNGPADYFLGNQLIRTCNVPIILVRTGGAGGHRVPWRKLLKAARGGLVQGILNRRFESQRQSAFARELRERLADAGSCEGYLEGPRVVEIEDIHSPEAIARLREAGVNLLFQNGAGIIRRPLIEAFAGRILNVHHGYLPSIRGCHSIAWALLERRPEWVGVSVHLIDEGLDTGPILRRERIAVGSTDTYESLFARATLLGADLLTQAAVELAAGTGEDADSATTNGGTRQEAQATDGPGEYRGAMTRRHWLALRDKSPAPASTA